MVYKYSDIVNCFRTLGIKEGDNVFIHSNLGFFGRLEGCSSADELCENFVRAIVEVIGTEGTCVVPTFTYSFCNGEVYDMDNSPTKCGMFPEYIRKMEGTIRSEDPNFSIAVFGKNKELYTKNPTNESFGKGSFWERFMMTNGKFICMNYYNGPTFVHFAEKENNVPYRYNKAFNGVIKSKDVYKRDYFVHFVYDKEKEEDGTCLIGLDRICEKKKIYIDCPLGKGNIRVIDANQYYKCICDILKDNPRFLTKGNFNE